MDLSTKISVCLIGTEGAGKSSVAGAMMGRSLGYYGKEVQRQKERFFANNPSSKDFNCSWLIDKSKWHPYLCTRGTITNNYRSLFELNTVIYDTPGHVKYWKRGINFMALSDACIVIIDALSPVDSPLLLKILITAKHFGAQQLIVAFTHMDKLEDAKQKYQSLEFEAQAILSKAGFEPEHILGFVPTVATNQGVNIWENENVFSWYEGPAVATLIKAVKKMPHCETGDGYGIVDESYRIGGIGTVVTVSMLRGIATFNQNMYLTPLNDTRQAFTLEHFHESIDCAKAGDFVGINLRRTHHWESDKQFLVFPKPGTTEISPDAFIPHAVDCFYVDAIVRGSPPCFSKPFNQVDIISRCHTTTAIITSIESLEKSDESVLGAGMEHTDGRRIRLSVKCSSRIVVAPESRIPELSKLMLLDSSGAVVALATVTSILQHDHFKVNMTAVGPIHAMRHFSSSSFSAHAWSEDPSRIDWNQTQIISVWNNNWSSSDACVPLLLDFVNRGGTLVIVENSVDVPNPLGDLFGIEYVSKAAPQPSAYAIENRAKGAPKLKPEPVSHLEKQRLLFQRATDIELIKKSTSKPSSSHSIDMKASSHEGQWFPDEIWQHIIQEATSVDLSTPLKFFLVSKYLHTCSKRLGLPQRMIKNIKNYPDITFAAKSSDAAQRLLNSTTSVDDAKERLKSSFSRYLERLGEPGGVGINGPAGRVACIEQDSSNSSRIRINNPELFKRQGGRVVCATGKKEALLVHFPRFSGASNRLGQIFLFPQCQNLSDKFWINLYYDAAAFGALAPSTPEAPNVV